MEGELEQHDVDDAPPATVITTTTERRNGKRAGAGGGPSSIQSQMNREDDLQIREIIEELGGDAVVKINITRRRPMMGAGGLQIGGSLETIDGAVDEEYIRETWGGGEYLIRFSVPKPNGSMKWMRNKTLKLAGPPKMHGRVVGGGGEPGDAVAAGEVADPMAARAFEMMADMTREERARADRLRDEVKQPRDSGFDVSAFQALNEPLLEQLRGAQAQARELQMKVIELSTKEPPKDEFRDRLMTKMIDGESARIEQLRGQYENRIEKLREYHEDQVKRMEDRHTSDIARLEDRHMRELRAQEKALDAQRDTSKSSFDMRIDAKEETIKRLERELAAALTRIGSLEAKKDQTISEKADELIKVKEALDGIGGDGDDSDKPWYERLLEVAGNSEAAMALIGKLGGAPPQGGKPGQPQQPNQAQLPPPGIPFQTGDGNVYVRDAAGNVTILDQGMMRKQRALAEAKVKRKTERQQQQQRPAAPQQQAAPGQVAPPAATPTALDEGLDDDDDDDDSSDELALQLDEKDVKIALSFMENAIKNGTPPEKFAQTARSLVPGDVVSFLQRFGVRKLLSLVKLDTNSPLTTQRGRVFADSVAKVLIGDV